MGQPRVNQTQTQTTINLIQPRIMCGKCRSSADEASRPAGKIPRHLQGLSKLLRSTPYYIQRVFHWQLVRLRSKYQIYRICNYDAQVRCSRVHGQNRAKRPLFSPRHSQYLYIVVVSIWALRVPNLQSLRKATEDLLRHYDFTQARHCIVRQRC